MARPPSHAELAVDHLPPLLDAPTDLVLVPEAAQHGGAVAPLNGKGVKYVDEFIEEQETRQRLIFAQLVHQSAVAARSVLHDDGLTVSDADGGQRNIQVCVLARVDSANQGTILIRSNMVVGVLDVEIGGDD